MDIILYRLMNQTESMSISEFKHQISYSRRVELQHPLREILISISSTS